MTSAVMPTQMLPDQCPGTTVLPALVLQPGDKISGLFVLTNRADRRLRVLHTPQGTPSPHGCLDAPSNALRRARVPRRRAGQLERRQKEGTPGLAYLLHDVIRS